MGLDASRLTKDEREELIIALQQRHGFLREIHERESTPTFTSSAHWRMYVVATLLDELDG